MRRSERIFQADMVLAISLPATVGGLAAEHLCGVNRSTLVIGPLVAISAVLVWSAARA